MVVDAMCACGWVMLLTDSRMHDGVSSLPVDNYLMGGGQAVVCSEGREGGPRLDPLGGGR